MKVKKIEIYGFIIGFMILLIPISNVTAWSNGSYSYSNTQYDYNDDYGTHDWIAEHALDTLMGLNAEKWQWLSDRKVIYLVGTEAPDNSGVAMTLDGETISGFGDVTWHHVYYNEDGTISNNEDDSALRSKACGDLADVAIEANQLDKAAYYLGAMTHYIADLGVYAHVAPNNVAPHNLYFDEYHSTYEGYVLTRTNDYINKEEFFKRAIITTECKTPYQAAIDVGWNTYKDPTPTETTTRDAVWMHNNFFTGWCQTYAARSGESALRQSYYNRVEESLNYAVSGCVAAMNYIGGCETTTANKSSLPGYPPILLFCIMGFMIAGISMHILKKRNHV